MSCFNGSLSTVELTIPQASVQHIPRISSLSYTSIVSSLNEFDMPEWNQNTWWHMFSGRQLCKNLAVFLVSKCELQ